MLDPGDIVHLDFDPAAGHEMQGRRFGLVLSLRAFNQSGMAVICLITQGAQTEARAGGFAVSLMGCGTQTQGVVLSHQAKTLDWRSRRASRKERVPPYLLEDVLGRYRAIFPQ